jgi:D-amino-acid dehydrogenase
VPKNAAPDKPNDFSTAIIKIHALLGWPDQGTLHMRIAVVGAGIVGVTTAYELTRAGHYTTIYERRDTVAAEASYANAGVVAPGYVTPWAAPGMPLKVLRHLCAADAPIRLAGLNAFREWRWMLAWWRACDYATHVANRSAMQRLARLSLQRLTELTQALGMEYEQNQSYLVLLRDKKALRQAKLGLTLLTEAGVKHALVDAAQCRLIEPALNPQVPLVGAVHLPLDVVGNCRLFANQLRQQAQAMGAQVEFGRDVTGIQPGSKPKLTFADASTAQFDAVVICAGVQANTVLRSVGLELPLMPVYGYSVTAPARLHETYPDMGPRSGVMDERFKVTVTKLGGRIRVAGTAELGGQRDRLNPAALRTLYRVADEWFPGAMNKREAQEWKGARPMLPDGPPILGASGAPGVWLNVGHGSSGWALACGSALVLAERISGRESPIGLNRLGLSRLGLNPLGG